MKTAVRFPVKSSPELLLLCLVMHLIVAVAVLINDWSWWISLLVIVVIAASWGVTTRQYHSVTNAKGDLCWTGESWMIAKEHTLNQADYLELRPTSWVTSLFSFLEFQSGDKKVVWLFTNKHLGERAYRELCYLVNQDLHLSRKNQ